MARFLRNGLDWTNLEPWRLIPVPSQLKIRISGASTPIIINEFNFSVAYSTWFGTLDSSSHYIIMGISGGACPTIIPTGKARLQWELGWALKDDDVNRIEIISVSVVGFCFEHLSHWASISLCVKVSCHRGRGRQRKEVIMHAQAGQVAREGGQSLRCDDSGRPVPSSNIAVQMAGWLAAESE